MNLVLKSIRMDSQRLALNMVEDKAYSQYEAFATNKEGAGWPSDPTAADIMRTWPSGLLGSLHSLYHGLTGDDSIPGSKGQGGRHIQSGCPSGV